MVPASTMDEHLRGFGLERPGHVPRSGALSAPIDIGFGMGCVRKLPTSHPGATLASEMDAVVWTALAILAAMSGGTLFYLGSKIDALAARMDARFERVDARFDHMEERFDALAARFDAHLDRHAG